MRKIIVCSGGGCKVKSNCHRFTERFKYQSQSSFRHDKPPMKDGWCNFFWNNNIPIREIKEQEPIKIPFMQQLISIEDHDGIDPSPMIIGVASDMENARRMRDQYYGIGKSNFKIIKIEDIRDSGIEYIEHYIDNDGDEGKIVYRDFQLNEI